LTDLSLEGLETRAIAWAEERFTGGTYICFEPGQLSQFGSQLTRPHGRVHFAAAERSPSSVFMEGAIESGVRVAAEIPGMEGEGRGGRRRTRLGSPASPWGSESR
jgi:monoamine oxidase